MTHRTPSNPLILETHHVFIHKTSQPLNSVKVCRVLPRHIGSSENPTGAPSCRQNMDSFPAFTDSMSKQAAFKKRPLRNITVTQMPPPYFRVVITHWCWWTINLKIFCPDLFTTLISPRVTNLLNINWNWLSAAIKTIWLPWLREYGS